ncbi:tryptophan--tRNA ligase [Patescibacteria group bacterium]|nr:tryptophan--tRNA ligase [Patescibacteria group bacterium]MBU4274637.1 tryptophan--tRNA ligase [Patescibacteria group bacterium]MBU4367683.1 tryptophan--tRNA ligase [Patescibacteria group bacterium]MBU4461867.1 tryptophan--tRNA ligase [Patescibacteria group bacterium]MCG2700002.1 tryptophan--tRNA ligase [Candidatus Parcubacteria bacterium]
MIESDFKNKERLLSGMRPTGSLHLGHFVGALDNWLSFQDEFDCFFLISDYQAFGDYSDNIELIRKAVYEITLDWLSVGLDPQKCNFVVQSYVPEHAELYMLLSMIIPLSEIKNNPTLKTEMKQISKQISLGFFNYPATQVADILLARAHIVPVGEDQLPHIELTRRIARKFNKIYKDVFPIPRAVVGRIPRLPGIDGNLKMGKSLNNAIYLSDDEATVVEKVKKMYTDPKRIHANIPGTVEGNPVFLYHDAFNPNIDEVNNLKELYRKGKVSDSEVKRKLAEALNQFLKPIRERRQKFQQRPNFIKEILVEGSNREKKIAQETIKMVKEAMGIIY